MTGHIRQRDGFTLVEMMVAIVIFGIAMAIAVPNFRGSLDRARADRVETELQSDLRLALSTAKATGRTMQIRFDQGGYRVVDAADTSRVYQARDYEGSIAVTATGNPLVFPWGMVQPADLNVAHHAGYTDFLILPTGRIEDAAAYNGEDD